MKAETADCVNSLPSLRELRIRNQSPFGFVLYLEIL